MMQGDDIRNMRQQAERLSAAEAHADTQNFSALALWTIAEQLYEIRRLLGLASEVIDPGAGEQFPGVVRVRIHHQEES